MGLRSIRLASLWVCARSLVWYSILTGQEDAAGVSRNHERIQLASLACPVPHKVPEGDVRLS